MKNECSYVQDVLSLYLENMVSEETGAFVQEHLAHCPTCAAELEAMKAGTKADKLRTEIESKWEAEAIKSMQSVRKKFCKKTFRTSTVMVAIAAVVCVLLYIFPVYRLIWIGSRTFGDFYSAEQIGKALYIGAPFDRREAQAMLRLADQAFYDVQHTGAENEEEYGLLARYATATDCYTDAAFNEHSLELWSAHLDDRDGCIWVYYSSETFNHDGDIICGSWRIPSLWQVEKNEHGEWVVVQIYEHP